ncbi:MAG TPA: Flp family type IVb pilin [Aestuariivirga sp.]|nr:Flp family type IVb pilin [Aestuariivirga sp.]
MCDESGATAIEYGLIAAGIVLALISAMPLLTNNMNNTYNQILLYFNDVGA